LRYTLDRKESETKKYRHGFKNLNAIEILEKVDDSGFYAALLKNEKKEIFG
jgi:hypothetical protein